MGTSLLSGRFDLNHDLDDFRSNRVAGVRYRFTLTPNSAPMAQEQITLFGPGVGDERRLTRLRHGCHRHCVRQRTDSTAMPGDGGRDSAGD